MDDLSIKMVKSQRRLVVPAQKYCFKTKSPVDISRHNIFLTDQFYVSGEIRALLRKELKHR